MNSRLAVAVFGLVSLFGCSSKSSGDSAAVNPQTASDAAPSVAAQGNDKLSGINPCSLLTDEEIGTANDNRLPPSQRDGLHASGAKYEVSKQEDRSGVTPVCHVHWRAVAPGNDEHARGDFDIFAMTASHLKSLEQAIRPKTGKRAGPIAGVGDEAFYLEYAPSARVGNLGVSISEFSSADGGIELLKEAVARLR